MKKITIVAVACMMLLGSFAVADAGQRNYGCGLGTMLLGESNDGLIMQTLAMTTNGSTGTQLFGVSSGTSQCEQFKGIVLNKPLYNFVSANMEVLASNIASGKGEALDTLAELMGIEGSKRAAVYSSLKSNFSTIFSSPDVEASAVIDSIAGIVSAS